MLEILIHNKEQYARWEANMEEITRLLGPTAAEEFGKLGPEANSAMEEILASEELLAQYQEVFGVTIDETTGAAIEAWNDPDFIGAPAAAMESAASQISESSTLNEAAQSQVEGTKEAFDDAVETVDFGARRIQHLPGHRGRNVLSEPDGSDRDDYDPAPSNGYTGNHIDRRDDPRHCQRHIRLHDQHQIPDAAS